MTWTEFTSRFPIQLNQQQESAVQSVEGPVLLLAVPGSGKTTVLVTRLGYMIFCKGIAPERILTVTYTVAATKDMAERFACRFGAEMAGRLEFRTINGICARVIQYCSWKSGRTAFSLLTDEKRIEADDCQSEADRAFAKLLFARAGKVEPATRTQRAQISMYLNDYSMPRELLLYAAECSRGANEPFGKMKRLLNDWHEHGVSTIAAAQERQKAAAAAPATPARRGTPYAQHPVREGALDHLILDLNEEL